MIGCLRTNLIKTRSRLGFNQIACGHVYASSQSMRLILSLKMNSSFITSRPGLYQYSSFCKVSKGAKIRNRYNQVPHLTQDTTVKVTNSQLYTTNESQEVSPFPAGDQKAHINRSIQMHSKHKTEKNPRKDLQKSTAKSVLFNNSTTIIFE